MESPTSSAAWTDPTSLSLGLNLGGGGCSPQFPKEAPPAGFLEAELARVSEENRRLNERLAAVCESYSALQNQLMEVMAAATASSEKTRPSSDPSRKRKGSDSHESVSNEDAVGGGATVDGRSCRTAVNYVESTSSEELDSCKKLWEESKLKITKTHDLHK